MYPAVRSCLKEIKPNFLPEFPFFRWVFARQTSQAYTAPFWPTWNSVWCQQAVPVHIWRGVQTLSWCSQHMYNLVVYWNLWRTARMPNQAFSLGRWYQLWRGEVVCEWQVCRQEALWCKYFFFESSIYLSIYWIFILPSPASRLRVGLILLYVE